VVAHAEVEESRIAYEPTSSLETRPQRADQRRHRGGAGRPTSLIVRRGAGARTVRAALVDPAAGLTFDQRIQMGVEEVGTILRKIWPYLLVGIGLGAVIHGWVPTVAALRQLLEDR
jgi:hypothetical protein